MKKLCMLLMLLLAMTIGSHRVFAQSVTVTLMPGWNWISVPLMDTLDFETAMGSFTPVVGDIVKSQWGNANYRADGQWRGTISQFYPGYGYMYKSNRAMPVTVTFQMQQPASQVIITTAEPTIITTESAVVGGTVTIGEGNHVFARGICWGMEPTPTIDGNHISNGAEIGVFSDTLTELTPSTTYYVRAYVVTDCGLAYGEEVSFTTFDIGDNDHDYVDLGLPSGLLWATCNLGADIPEDYGDYFAWGETQPKEYYYFNTYQYCNGSYYTLTKYCNMSNYGYNGFTDNLTTLLPEDDAATANWGADWRMPTKEEWKELYNNTTCMWTTQNGVNGRLFIASNGNSLFLPAAGSRYYSSLFDSGSYGYYWSSSLDTSSPDVAWSFYFFSEFYITDSDSREGGQSVRAVRMGQNSSYIINVTANPMEGGTITGGGTYHQDESCTLMASANEGYLFTSWTENGEVVCTNANYSFTVIGDRVLVANFIYNDGGNHEYVDLGLPSGLLWATCNVGADTPEDYGDYFAWGETQLKDYYDWSTYQYCNGSYNTLTKYCNNSSYGYNGFTDNLTTLLPEDDAAMANWGAGWRMPTQAEWQELLDNTTDTWTQQNGVNGHLFTASNGNSLFLPAVGYRSSSELYDTGSVGTYWSSSLITNIPDPDFACYFGFYSDNYDMYGGYRDNGHSVRAVRSTPQNTPPTGAIDGKFTINANGDQVYFSQGNLQYQASTNTWRFAESQWDYVGTQYPDSYGAFGGTINGSDNSNISESYNGWIDLFGWGTSGYNHGAICYQPWSTSRNTSDYYVYGDITYNLFDQTGKAEWGYNPISNGGNMENSGWRTLTDDEWTYIMSLRSTISGVLFAKGQVNGHKGVFVFPDDWSSANYAISNTNGGTFSSNIISLDDWINVLEPKGVVFLPAAGMRDGVSVVNVNVCGYYYCSTRTGFGANNVHFNNGYLWTQHSLGRTNGQSVRLVQLVQ